MDNGKTGLGFEDHEQNSFPYFWLKFVDIWKDESVSAFQISFPSVVEDNFRWEIWPFSLRNCQHLR
jgi:hypothetical protein